MAGHTVTPYSVIAKRKHARGERDNLLLASLSPGGTVDLLDVVAEHITAVDPQVSTDGATTIRCEVAERKGDSVMMVIAIEVTGEQEIVRRAGDREVVLVKEREHITQYYSCALLWRPPSGTEGMLLTHSPWGRGGRRTAIAKLIQRAVNVDGDTKALIKTDTLVPAAVLERYLRQAKATRIIYSKGTGITSTFGGKRASTPAEVDLVVKGSDSAGFRDQLSKVLKQRKEASLEGLFRIQVRDPDGGGYREEEFDDVSVDIPVLGGVRRYSLKKNTVPTLGFDATEAITSAYHDLAGSGEGEWAERLLRSVRPKLEQFREELTRADT